METKWPVKKKRMKRSEVIHRVGRKAGKPGLSEAGVIARVIARGEE